MAHYKNDGIMKFLMIVGGLVGLATIILALAAIFGLPSFNLYPIYQGVQFGDVIGAVVIGIIGILVCFATILTAIKPDDPLPFHWLFIFILGVLLIIFGAGIWACALTIIASLIGIIDEL
ncbi:MAG: conserved membrane protein of unknown function [Promethearchaeota archaeon]|nr:MAG: conserved membrane protein of unknown function [Candidatus Lokiarchaeota archaeon]